MSASGSVSWARPPVRVAVVGLGWAAKSIWLPRLHAHPAFTVSSVVDPDPAACAGAVQSLTETHLLSSVDELTSRHADLAVVAVPNHLHADIACRLLTNGIPVFVEKPVCLDSDEARRLMVAESAGGAVLLAGSAARHRADVLALGDLVRGLGRIRHVELSWVRARGIPDAGGWFTRRSLSGGGALVDLGWHLLDTVAPLLGEVGFEQALATVSDDFVRSAAARASWRDASPDASSGASSDASSAAGAGAVAEAEAGGRAVGSVGGAVRGAAGGAAGGQVDGDVEDTVRGFIVADGGVSVSLRAGWASHEPRDVTLIRVDGSAGTATLRCTFGFSPNRVDSELTLTRDGEVSAVPFPQEPVGAEYMRQLDRIPGMLADPASRGRAAAETLRTIQVIERLYDSARAARTTGAAGPRNRTGGQAIPAPTLA
ncbi:Gfo/Idh/MocA family protein [Streptomyces sp. NPDC014995]|uniref:Gfo/Idh/MocA family protein n=1 Tax=Streptomyces sp. NPDC014995 TaxID=3364936 RepID=UPI0036FB8750